MKINHALMALCTALALAACGSNSYEDTTAPPVTTNEVPASATASVASYTQYASSLPRSESGEPLNVNKVVPPTSETALASALN
jgi:uncharacterized lipoprotein YmbA